MARVYVSLGSNVDRERHIAAAIRGLRRHFGKLALSGVYESDPVGFEGAPFYNLAVGFGSDHSPAELVRVFRLIEKACGRTREAPKFGPRTLDLDLLLCGDMILDDGEITLPRRELTRFAYVLAPLAEICGSMPHPVLGETFSRLWSRFDDSGQRIRRLDVSAGDFEATPASSPRRAPDPARSSS